MLRFLTQKLKAQSLNEVTPFQQPAKDCSDDNDSGTESDEENAELQTLEDMKGLEDKSLDTLEKNLSGSHSWPCSPNILQPILSSTSPLSSVGAGSGPTTARRPLQLVSNQQIAHPEKHRTLSPPLQDSSDFERCSFDYEPSSSAEFERHSSEEELEVINCHTQGQEDQDENRQQVQLQQQQQQQREKRKWSQVDTVTASCQETSSGSSDDEVRDLLSHPPKPLSFSSSPPKGVHKVSQTTMSPRLFMANVSPSSIQMCTVSPRKRHRQTSGSDDSEATVVQRPCLDFDKMQRAVVLRRQVSSHHGSNKARIVKIKTLSHGNTVGAACGSSRGAAGSCKSLYDPAVFAFRSISTAYNSLTPVEDTVRTCAF